MELRSRASLHPRPKETGFCGQLDKININRCVRTKNCAQWLLSPCVFEIDRHFHNSGRAKKRCGAEILALFAKIHRHTNGWLEISLVAYHKMPSSHDATQLNL
jgi:hypothetical protein